MPNINVLHDFGAACAQMYFVQKHMFFVQKHMFFVRFIDVGIDVGIDVPRCTFPFPAQLHQSMEKALAKH